MKAEEIAIRNLRFQLIMSWVTDDLELEKMVSTVLKIYEDSRSTAK